MNTTTHEHHRSTDGSGIETCKEIFVPWTYLNARLTALIALLVASICGIVVGTFVVTGVYNKLKSIDGDHDQRIVQVEKWRISLESQLSPKLDSVAANQKATREMLMKILEKLK